MCTTHTTVVVHRNFEAGKQLVISTINGNDSLGWIDTLTRVDIKRRFQYFLYAVEYKCIDVDVFQYASMKYFRPYEYCSDISGSNVTIEKAWDWIGSSKYKEQRVFSRLIVNIWSYEVCTHTRAASTY